MSKSRLVAALTLSAVIAYPALVAAAEYFRLQMPEGVTTSSDGPPDAGGNSSIEIQAEGGMWRAPANVSIPVLITGGDGTYTIQDNSLDLEWVQTETDGSVGRGAITGQIHTTTSYVMTPFDSSGAAGVPKTIELQVFPPLLVEVPPSQLQPVSPGASIAIDADVLSGQIGSIDWNWVGGVPSGYTLNRSTGVITGTAGGPGSVPSMELEATDSMDDAKARTGEFTISVVAEPIDVSISGGTWRLPDPVQVLVTKGGSYGPLEVAATLPAGLVYNASTGMIEGVVPDTGAKQVLPIAVEVSDSYGSPTATDEATVVVLPKLSLSMPTPTNAVVGEDIEVRPNVAGVVGTGSWSLRSGALPTGVSLDSSSGLISGAASEPTSATGLVLGVVDSEDGKQVVSNSFDIVVVHDLVADAFSIPAATGRAVGVTVTSDTIAPTGFTADLPLAATNGAEISVAGGAWATSGTLSPGQSFRVRLKASLSYGATVSTTVSAGATTSTWSVTTKTQDATPDAFSIPDVASMAISTQRVSESIVPTGFDGSIAISATNGGQVSINGGAYAASTSISAGDSFTVRNTSSSTYETVVDTVVTIGGVSDTWTITTKAQDRTPAQFDVVEVSGAQLASMVVSDPVTPVGYEGSVNVSATGGAQISVDSGPWAASSTIAAGQSFRVRLMSSAAYLGIVTSTVTVGTVTDLWIIASRAQDITPDAFAMTDVLDQDVLAEVTSAAVTPVGYEGSISISVNNGASLSVDGGAFSTSSTIQPGQSFRVRMTASPYYDAEVATTVAVGGTTDIWSIRTHVQDATPDAFSIVDVSGANPATSTTSASVTPVGYEGSVTISASNGGQISVNNGSWVASGSIKAGEPFRVRNASSSTYGGAVDTIVSIGGVSDTWTIGTRAADLTPDSFVIATINGRNPSASTTSAAVLPTGYETSVAISATNGAQVQVGGSGSWLASTTISAGQSFQVRMNASATFGGTVSSVVTVGGVQATWTIGTRAQDVDPDLFMISTVNGVEPSARAVSAAVTPVGYESTVTVSATNGAEITVDGGTTWSASTTIAAGGSFQVRMNASASFGGAVSTTVTIGSTAATWSVNTRAADLVPDAFTVPDLTGQDPSTLATSAAVTPTGYETSVSISATNGAAVSVATGPWLASTTIASGQSFRVRMTSSSAFSTAATSVVTVGGVSDTWSVTTRAQDIAPTAFDVVDVSNVERSTASASVSIVPTGYEGTVSVSATNGAQISINGGAFVVSPTTMSAGDSVRLRMTSSSNYSTGVSTVVTIGSVSDDWTVTTRAIDSTPDAFVVPALSGQNVTAQVTSASVPPTGYEGSVSISATNGATISIDGGATWSASSTISAGGSFQVRMTSSASYATGVSTVVTVGGVAATWTVTTKAQDVAPDAFVIAAVSGVERSTRTQSASVTPVGYEGTVSISASNGGEVSTDAGSTWAPTGSLTSGGSFLVRNTSSGSFSTAVSTVVTVGSGTATWSLTTRAIDLTPNAFSVPAVSGQEVGVQVVSTSVIPTGYEGAVSISATNGAEVRINGTGSWSASASISPSQSFEVRMTASGSYATGVSSVVTIGGVAATWTVTTKSQDVAPDAFAVPNVSGVERNAQTDSASVTPVGYEGSVSISTTNGATISIDGGAFVASPTTISLGQSFRLRLNASGSFSAGISSVVTVGTTQSTWTVTTRAIDVTPNAFAVSDVVGQATSTLVTSGQIAASGFDGSLTLSATNGAQVSVVGSGTWSASASISAGESFQVRMTSASAYNATVSSDVGIGSVSDNWSITTKVQDVAPDAFSFPSVTNQEKGALVTSSSVTPAGYDAPLAVSVTGGEISINGGAWVSSGSISTGQTIQLRTTSSSTFGASVVPVLTIGSSSVNWTVTTRAQDIAPNAFAIPATTGQNVSIVSYSTTVAPTGFEDVVALSATNGAQVSIVGSGTWAASTTIAAGQSFQVRMTSSSSYGTSLSTTVSVGSGTATWTVTTKVQDVVPDVFTIPALTGQEISTTVSSASVTPTGFDGTVSIGTTNGATISINGGAFSASPRTITSGDSFQVQRNTAATWNAAVTTDVTIGSGTPVTWTVTTRLQDTAPDAFAIPALTGQEISTTVSSAAVTPVGYEGSVSIATTNGATISIAGDAFSASTRTITAGQSFRVQRSTSSAYNTSVSTDVTVGTGAAVTWTATTKVQDTAPDAFTIPALTGQELSTPVNSASVTPTGYEGSVSITATSGALISINGGPFSGSPRAISAGDSFRVQRSTSASWSSNATTDVTIGTGATVTWTTTTRAQDTLPDAFVIAAATGQLPGAVVTSAAVTPLGYEGSVTISATNGATVTVDGGTTWAASATLASGGSFQVRLTASSSYNASVATSVTVGSGVAATWTVTTKVQDTLPDVFTVPASTGLNVSTATISSSVTPLGYEGPVSIATTNGATISINGGAFVASPTTIAAGQSFRLQRNSSASYNTSVTSDVTVGTGVAATWTATTKVQDTAPDAFTIPALTGQNPGATASSSLVTPTGYDGTVSISATNGAKIEIAGSGTFVSSPTTITSGQSFRVQRNASASFSTVATTDVTIGTGAAVTWSVTTRSQDATPDAFVIPALTGQEISTSVSSVAVTPTGYEGTVSITTTNGATIQVGSDSTFYASPRTITAGESFRVQRSTSASYSSNATTDVTVGAAAAVTWTTTTRAQDTSPNAFVVPTATGLVPNAVATSAGVTPTGYEGSVTVAATNGATVSVDGGTTFAASATLTSGGSFQVRITASASYSTSVTSSVTVGTGTPVTWTVTTKVQDTAPDAFVIPALTGQELSTTVNSASVTPTGFDGSVSITTTNGALISINGGAYAASPRTIASGDSFRVQRSTSSSYGSNATTDVTIGTGAAVTWTTTTRAQDVTPDAFSIAAATGQIPSTLVTSSIVTPVGYEGSVSISATNGAVLTVDGGTTWVASATLASGGSFQVRMTASSAYNTTVTSSVTVGAGTAVVWNVTTKVQDTAPDAFAVPALTSQNVGTVVASASVTPVGYEGSVSISTTNGATISVNGGAFVSSPTTIVAGQSFRLQRTTSAAYNTAITSDVTVGTGAAATWSITTKVQDTLPDAFTIAAVTGQNPNTSVSSASVTPTGFDGTVAISTTNGATIEIAGSGTFVSSPTSITSGQSFRVQRNASASFSSAVTTDVAIGTGAAVTWSITTRAQDATPDAFAVATVVGQNKNVLVTSVAVTPVGYEGTVTLSATNGAEVSVGSSGVWATSASLVSGQSFLVRMTSANAYSTNATTTVTVGTGTASWTVTTRAQDTTPDAFVVPDLTGQEAVATVASVSVTPVGYEDSVTITTTNGALIEVGGTGGFLTSPRTITAGQSFRVQMTSATYSTVASTTVTVGGTSDVWNVTTRAIDTTPNAFSVPDVAGQEPSASVTSSAVTLSGFDGTLTISPTNAQVSVGAGSFSASATITSGQTFRLQRSASASFATALDAVVTVGGVSDTWTVTTRAQDVTPDSFLAGNDVLDVEPSTLITSGAITAVGFEGSVPISASNGGQISLDGGSTWIVSGTYVAGNSFLVRNTSSSTFLGMVTTGVTVGGAFLDWDLVTRAQDTQPNAFSIVDATGQNPSTQVSSAGTTVAGFDGPVTASATNGALMAVNGGTYVASVSVNPGDSVSVRMASSGSFSQTVSTVVTVGTRTSTWNVTTRAASTQPDAFVVPDTTDAALGAVITSLAVAPTGFDVPVTLQASNGGTVSIVGSGSYATSTTLSPGQSFTVRVTSSAAWATPTAVVVDAGGRTATWAVTTRDQDVTANAFSITDLTNQNPVVDVISAAVAPAGFEGSIPISVTGGTVSVAGGAYATSGTIALGQSFTVKLRTASYGGTATATVSLGGQSSDFTATTRAQDTTPVGFTFIDQTGVAPSTLTTSNTVTVTGIEGNVPISVSGGSFKIDSAAYRTSATTITNNATLTLQRTSSATAGADATVTITVGTYSTTWTITTRNTIASVNVLVVGGGGGGASKTTTGGGFSNGSGGGGGGLVESTVSSISGSYSVVVGSGGTANNDGASSSALGVTAGGGLKGLSTKGGTSGAPQSKVGGTPTVAGSGGGGAGAVGANTGTCCSNGGAGGNGVASSYSGSSVTYGGGGGGWTTISTTSNLGGAGGSGGGGQGGSPNWSGVDGTPNTGGGGGGGYSTVYTGGDGGSGVVIIRYSGSTVKATGGTITVSGGFVIHKFTSSGTFTVN